ncbi:MAG: SpoIIE family protein phosphatase [Bacteroidales bacterium]|nr:SpoIIE family protein phosphatase [Bacteroidales bacterium]
MMFQDISFLGTSIYHYIIYSVLVGLIVYLVVRYQTSTLVKTRRLLREKEKAYEKITRQREELEIKNKNITDSLVYASYMQQALLPSEDYFKSILPDSFIFFKPKDIVSGDFYWITKKDNVIFVVAADCTGHGVPGAFMSMIGVELLNKLILDQDIQKPSEILEILGKGIARTFGSVGDDKSTILKDGMDIGLCAIDEKKAEIQYSGAFFPMYIIRDNKLTEIKGDRMSVGVPGEMLFTNKTMKMEPGDIIYLFSDGYADQFGGPANKKFMYRRFRHLLLTIHKFQPDEQKAIIHESIEAWRRESEQVDDIIVIGMRPSFNPAPGL